jgi:REP element-mobilizing transposase RayT
VQIIKSLTAREILSRVPSLKKQMWGGALWASGYYVSTVSRRDSEDVISNYVKKQGTGEETYTKLHTQQLDLFE